MRLYLSTMILLTACPDPHSDVDSDPGTATETGTETETDSESESDTETDSGTDSAGFVDVAEASGLKHVHWDAPDDWRPACNGAQTHTGGASAGDYDNDGFIDLFFAVDDGPDRLYRNRGDGTFDEVGAKAGVAHVGHPSGTAWADLDGDGLLNLLVSSYHEEYVRLYMNQGDGTFSEQASARGLVAPDERALFCSMTWSISTADPDLDGDLDVFVASWNTNLFGKPELAARFFVNTGRGEFIDRTEAYGLVAEQPWIAEDRQIRAMSFTPSFGDLNGDGWPDLALASDFNSNTLFFNDTEGRFTEDFRSTGIRDVQNAMGSALADVDGDGDLDWWISAIWDTRGLEEFSAWGHSGNRLYLNDGHGSFHNAAPELGLEDGGWAWGVAAFDADQDGLTDLMLTNGHIMTGGARYLAEPFETDPTRLWRRTDDGRYDDISEEIGIRDHGQGRSLLTFDLENDGNLDVLIAQFQARPILYRNDLGLGQGVRVRLRDIAKNSHGVGAIVELQRTASAAVQTVMVHGNSTYLGTSPPEAHFGLGDHSGPIHRIEVHWPGQQEPQVLENVSLDEVITVNRRR